MFKEIGSYEAKTNLPKILRRVEAGETFTITNRGKPIADLIPSRSGSRLQSFNAINNILNSKRYHVSDRLLAELKNKGRK